MYDDINDYNAAAADHDDVGHDKININDFDDDDDDDDYYYYSVDDNEFDYEWWWSCSY